MAKELILDNKISKKNFLGGKYDFSRAIYIIHNEKIMVTFPEHNETEQQHHNPNRDKVTYVIDGEKVTVICPNDAHLDKNQVVHLIAENNLMLLV